MVFRTVLASTRFVRFQRDRPLPAPRTRLVHHSRVPLWICSWCERIIATHESDRGHCLHWRSTTGHHFFWRRSLSLRHHRCHHLWRHWWHRRCALHFWRRSRRHRWWARRLTTELLQRLIGAFGRWRWRRCLHEAAGVFDAEALLQQLRIERGHVDDTGLHERCRDIDDLQRRLTPERLVARLGRTALHFEVELAFEAVSIEVDPALDGHRDDASDLFAGRVLLHQADYALTDFGQDAFHLGEPVLGARIGGVLDHRRLGGGALDLLLRLTALVVADA